MSSTTRITSCCSSLAATLSTGGRSGIGSRVGSASPARDFNSSPGTATICCDLDATSTSLTLAVPAVFGRETVGVQQYPEFLKLLAERAQKYFFDDGMFTDAKLLEQIDALAAQIRIVGDPRIRPLGIGPAHAGRYGKPRSNGSKNITCPRTAPGERRL